jgi:hypothetical protein
MADLAHQFGEDLQLGPDGDLALSEGVRLGEERVLRRLMTAPGAYIWHIGYGAGLPLFVGEVANKPRIAAVTRTQMYLESRVARTPPPAIDVDMLSSGTLTLSIRYADVPTQLPVVLTFNIPGPG